MSTTQPPQWDDECTQRLRDISLAIREHLELRRSKEEARSHARVNRGLGSFIAGKGTLTGWQSGANIDASLNDAEEGGLNAEQQHEHESLDLAAQHDETFTTLQQIPTRPADVSTPTPANSDGNGLRRIFSKAGNIIREAFEVEGCLLLRCRTWLLQTTCNFTLVEVSKSEEAPSQTVMTSSSDEQPQNSPRRIPDNASCDLLGFSTTDASSVNDPALLSKDIGCIPQRFLAKLLQRYPNGKIFNFDGIGELQTSDSSGYDDTLATPPGSLDPLQRVILSTDLLNDTNLSVFQKNAIHTIETCGRTLLDTIEPLLDYSKINSFAAKAVPVHMRKPGQQKRGKTDLFGKKSLFRHTRVDVLVEEVAESVFSGFIFQHMSVRQLSKQRKAGYLDTAVHNRLDAELAMEQLGLSLNDGKREHVESKNTSVYITIDPSCDWMFYTQPGALRRIFMYLLGNSLKYTTSGTIRISLSQRPSKRSSAERSVTLTVCDTGKGMGEDYMRHKLFKPFSQETDLTPGTGLGLSLVKRITSKLHGQISVESQIGVSTTVTVTLPLEQSLPKATEVGKYGDDDADFKNQVLELTNLRIRLRGFSADWIKDGRAIVEDICRHWLHLDPASDEGTTPDIVLWSEDALPSSLGDVAQLAKMPNVVVCRDALAAYQLMTRCEPVGQDRVFEYISQP
jgi:signal transduction histidine kinase